MVTKAEGVSCSRRGEGMKGHGGGWQDGRLRQRVEQVRVSPQSPVRPRPVQSNQITCYWNQWCHHLCCMSSLSICCVCVWETLALLHTVWPSSSCQNYWCSINIMPASGFHDVSWWFSLCPPLWLHECWTVFSVSGLQQQWICGSVSHGPGPSETVQASHLSWLK